MNKKRNSLELAEFFSVGSFFFGVITTAITKQILFSLTPLTFVVFFNIVNRHKHNYQPDLYSQQAEYTKELYQDLITFSDDYKYKKLELQQLIEEAQKQRLQLESSTKECLNNSQLSSIITRLNELESCWVELEVKLEESLDKAKISFLINQLNSLSGNQEKVSNYVYSELDKFNHSLDTLLRKINQFSQIQASINTIESRIQKIENNDSDFNNNYQSSIGNSINLTGLTEYYSLQGLTQRLIKEVENSSCIDNIGGNKTKTLDQDSIKSLKNISQRTEDLARIVITYHNDHKCSEDEAKKLSFELRQLAMAIRQSRSVYDLKLIYEVTERFTFQISRFQHKEIHHCWDTFMKNEIRGRLNKCKKDKNIK